MARGPILTNVRNLLRPGLYAAMGEVMRGATKPPSFKTEFDMWVDQMRDCLVFSLSTPTGREDVFEITTYQLERGDYIQLYRDGVKKLVVRAREVMGLPDPDAPPEPPELPARDVRILDLS